MPCILGIVLGYYLLLSANVFTIYYHIIKNRTAFLKGFDFTVPNKRAEIILVFFADFMNYLRTIFGVGLFFNVF